MYENPKIEVRETGSRGKGLFATAPISKDEIIFDWEGGKVYRAEKISVLPKEVQTHAIQFGEHAWIDTTGFGRFVNHSCTPNAGIHGLYKLVAMRNISTDEEILLDYAVTENSDWYMENCLCGSPNCRKNIHGYDSLPDKTKREYKGYSSDWLT